MLFEKVPGMAATQLSRKPRYITPELDEYVAAEAERDADRVGVFLRSLGLHGTPEKRISLPRRFLFRLATALRLQDWEAQGFSLHQTAGLPSARQAIDSAFQWSTTPGPETDALCNTVFRLSVERFAWHARRELEADVMLDEMFDDDALDALAKHLWATRHIGTTTDGPQPGAAHE
jgi:hypothetical protein